MALIKGRTITLYERVQNGSDAFGAPIYREQSTTVKNVLIQPTDASVITTEMELYGRHSAYTLHIPKGDTHNWDGAVVVLGGEFGNRRYRQFGDIMRYQTEMLPLDWCAQVKVEVYE